MGENGSCTDPAETLRRLTLEVVLFPELFPATAVCCWSRASASISLWMYR